LLACPVFNMKAKPGVEFNWQWLGDLSHNAGDRL